jgi:hypothetical protein
LFPTNFNILWIFAFRVYFLSGNKKRIKPTATFCGNKNAQNFTKTVTMEKSVLEDTAEWTEILSNKPKSTDTSPNQHYG